MFYHFLDVSLQRWNFMSHIPVPRAKASKNFYVIERFFSFSLVHVGGWYAVKTVGRVVRIAGTKARASILARRLSSILARFSHKELTHMVCKAQRLTLVGVYTSNICYTHTASQPHESVDGVWGSVWFWPHSRERTVHLFTFSSVEASSLSGKVCRLFEMRYHLVTSIGRDTS